jgi:hypothetical protein
MRKMEEGERGRGEEERKTIARTRTTVVKDG